MCNNFLILYIDNAINQAQEVVQDDRFLNKFVNKILIEVEVDE